MIVWFGFSVVLSPNGSAAIGSYEVRIDESRTGPWPTFLIVIFSGEVLQETETVN